MVTLKESVGTQISHGWLKYPDKIGALARAGKLGILMWRWKYADEDCKEQAINLLTRRAGKRLKIKGQQNDYERLRLLCRQVLAEWYSPECRQCQGVREVSGEHKRVVCESCEGTGIQRYGDFERSEMIGIDVGTYRKLWDKRFHAVYQMASAMDSETYVIVREQLKEDEALVHAEAE